MPEFIFLDWLKVVIIECFGIFAGFTTVGAILDQIYSAERKQRIARVGHRLGFVPIAFASRSALKTFQKILSPAGSLTQFFLRSCILSCLATLTWILAAFFLAAAHDRSLYLIPDSSVGLIIFSIFFLSIVLLILCPIFKQNTF